MRRRIRKAAGRFIVLEGLDGAGTTTQAERLSRHLRQLGHRVLTTREPSDGPVGTLLRQALSRRLGLPHGQAPLGDRTLALLFAADRVDHLEAEILPALRAGTWVVCDRYVLSSIAYQGLTLPTKWVEEANAFARAPDLTLLLEVSPRTASRRRAQRDRARELFEEAAVQRSIAKRYREAANRRATTDHVFTVDGEAPIDQVTEECLRIIGGTEASGRRIR